MRIFSSATAVRPTAVAASNAARNTARRDEDERMEPPLEIGPSRKTRWTMVRQSRPWASRSAAYVRIASYDAGVRVAVDHASGRLYDGCNSRLRGGGGGFNPPHLCAGWRRRGSAPPPLIAVTLVAHRRAGCEAQPS